MRIGLKVLLPFQVNQDVFRVGTFIPEEIIQRLNTNDPQQLANRLNNGWVKWEPMPDDAETEAVVDIDALDKAGLLEYAAQTFPGVKFDARQSETTLRQQVKSMKERMDLLAGKAAAQGARSGESAAKVGGGSSPASSAKSSAKVPPAKEPPAPPAGNDPPAGAGDGDQGGAGGAGNDPSTGGAGDNPPAGSQQAGSGS